MKNLLLLLFIFLPAIAAAQYGRDTITPIRLYENKAGVLCRKNSGKYEYIRSSHNGIGLERDKRDLIPLQESLGSGIPSFHRLGFPYVGTQYIETAPNQWEEHQRMDIRSMRTMANCQ